MFVSLPCIGKAHGCSKTDVYNTKHSNENDATQINSFLVVKDVIVQSLSEEQWISFKYRSRSRFLKQDETPWSSVFLLFYLVYSQVQMFHRLLTNVFFLIDLSQNWKKGFSCLFTSADVSFFFFNGLFSKILPFPSLLFYNYRWRILVKKSKMRIQIWVSSVFRVIFFSVAMNLALFLYVLESVRNV